MSPTSYHCSTPRYFIQYTALGRRRQWRHWDGGLRPRLFFRSDQNHFAGFDQLEFFAREFLDGGGIRAKRFDFVAELVVVRLDFPDLGFNGSELLRLRPHL